MLRETSERMRSFALSDGLVWSAAKTPITRKAIDRSALSSRSYYIVDMEERGVTEEDSGFEKKETIRKW